MKKILTKTKESVILRPLKMSDLPQVFAWVKAMEREDTFILLNSKEPITLKQEKEFFKSLMAGMKKKDRLSIGAWIGKKYLGDCSLEKLGKRQNHVARFGIALLKEYRSSGIGRQLAEYTIEQGRKLMGIIKIVLTCFANNQIGCRFYHALGFKEYGRLEKAIQYQGQLEDEIMFSKDLK